MGWVRRFYGLSAALAVTLGPTLSPGWVREAPKVDYGPAVECVGEACPTPCWWCDAPFAR